MSRVLETIGRLISKKGRIENTALLFNKLLPFFLGEELYKVQKPEDYREKIWREFKKSLVSDKRNVYIPKSIGKYQMYATTAYRLVIGMGHSSLFENGLLFHHTYGVPYIPGESLKGLARAVLLMSIYENEEVKRRFESLSELEEYLLKESEKFEKDERTPLLDNLEIELIFDADNFKVEKAHRVFRDIFGTLEKRGQVIFFDAFPETFIPSKHLEVDIMNVHHQSYYQSKKEPGDWEDPKPIKFLTVEEGVTFSIHIDVAPLREDFDERKAIDIVRRLLKIGLENFGLGGKKRKGYGWFKVT